MKTFDKEEVEELDGGVDGDVAAVVLLALLVVLLPRAVGVGASQLGASATEVSRGRMWVVRRGLVRVGDTAPEGRGEEKGGEGRKVGEEIGKMGADGESVDDDDGEKENGVGTVGEDATEGVEELVPPAPGGSCSTQ